MIPVIKERFFFVDSWYGHVHKFETLKEAKLKASVDEAIIDKEKNKIVAYGKKPGNTFS